jgi:hypothetical protein
VLTVYRKLERQDGRARRGNENQLFFDNVRVPAGNVVTLGDPEQLEAVSCKPLTIYNAHPRRHGRDGDWAWPRARSTSRAST